MQKCVSSERPRDTELMDVVPISLQGQSKGGFVERRRKTLLLVAATCTHNRGRVFVFWLSVYSNSRRHFGPAVCSLTRWTAVAFVRERPVKMQTSDACYGPKRCRDRRPESGT